MKITISQIAPTRSGLKLGLRIEDEKFGWIRFGTTVLLIEKLTYAEREMLAAWVREAKYREVDENDTPLFDSSWERRRD